uniref:Uncharacterized protein n=1 Tax=Amphimedon queenslandica TaxID=400682 RepID=A0A1X7UXC1_AMPQE
MFSKGLELQNIKDTKASNLVDTVCAMCTTGVLCRGICCRTGVLDGEQHFDTDISNFAPRIKDDVDTVGEPTCSAVDALHGTVTLPRAGILWSLTFDRTNGDEIFGEYIPI